MDDPNEFRRQVLVAVGILVAIGVVVGGIATVISMTAAEMTGITDNEPTTAATTSEPTDQGEADAVSETEATEPAEATDTTSTAPTATTPTTPTKTAKPARQRQPIVLRASPTSAGTYERVNLTGVYRRGFDIFLQVQRNEGGAWADFPTNATTESDGSFSTYVETGRPGPNRFRVLDPVTGIASNVVVVTIG
jgi:hypothetical protein